MALTIFSDLFEHINTTVIDSISTRTSEILTVLNPLIISGFIVYAMFVCLSYFNNPQAEDVILDIFKRFLAMAVIVTFSFNAGTYNDVVVPLVMNLGDELSNAFAGNSNEPVGSSLDTLIYQVLKSFDDTYKEVDWYKIGDVMQIIFFFLVVLVGVVPFAVIAFAYILIAKLTCAILSILGPVFIACALFPATRQFFSTWVNQVITQALTILILNILVGVMVKYLGEIVLDFSLGSVFSIAISSVIFFVMLLKAPDLAGSLGNGMSLGGSFSNAKRGASEGVQAAQALKGGAVGVGKWAVDKLTKGKNKMEEG